MLSWYFQLQHNHYENMAIFSFHTRTQVIYKPLIISWRMAEALLHLHNTLKGEFPSLVLFDHTIIPHVNHEVLHYLIALIIFVPAWVVADDVAESGDNNWPTMLYTIFTTFRFCAFTTFPFHPLYFYITKSSHGEGTTHKLKPHIYTCIEVCSINLCLPCSCNQICSVWFHTTAQFWAME